MEQAEPRLRVVWAPENQCVVDAYVRGYREALIAGVDWILEIDAGFSHQPQDIPQFFDTMLQGYDCVFGSRFMPGGRFSGGSLKRYLISRGGSVLANLVLGTKETDMTSGFELFSRASPGNGARARHPVARSFLSDRNQKPIAATFTWWRCRSITTCKVRSSQLPQLRIPLITCGGSSNYAAPANYNPDATAA